MLCTTQHVPALHVCLLQSGWVEIVSLVVIISNTAVMASQSYPGNPDWQTVSDYLNVAFCCYFTVELLVKLVGSGWKAFIRDRMNQFDALVVAASLVEMVMFLLPGDDTCKCGRRSCMGLACCLVVVGSVTLYGRQSTCTVHVPCTRECVHQSTMQ